MAPADQVPEDSQGLNAPSAKLASAWSTTKAAVGAGGIIIAIILAYSGAVSFVDKRIDDALSDPATLAAIATKVRPAIVFDSKGSILADQGGLQHIGAIEVLPGDGRVPKEIVVRPRHFLAVAPLLESLDEPGLNVSAARGKGIEWRLTLSGGGFVASGAVNPRFRLEVL